MFIKSIDANGIGNAIGLRKGDEVISINEAPVRDVIDCMFNIFEPFIHLRAKRNGGILEFDIEKDESEDLGVVFEEIQYRRCGSKCPFCFIDQNPEGLRNTLYFHDEDFRLSFLHGSYFTLNNISRKDLQRIVSQRLSPLYISVHALDREVRNFLFGVKRNDKLLEKIRFLVENNIELHTQIVLCPGINDKGILHDTIQGLEKFYPGVRSIAVIPLGLTKNREGLTQFQPVTTEYANKLIPEIHKVQRKHVQRYGERFVYLSDEWYLKAGRRLPSLMHYDDFFQLENGVGLIRQFLKDINKQKYVFKRPLSSPKRLHILTGTLAHPILVEHLVPLLEQAEGLTVTVTGVVNDFYGPSVDVSGLLSGRDFIRAINEDNNECDLFLLPPNCMNPDGLTIDDESLDSIMQKTGRRLMVYKGDFEEVRKAVEKDELRITNAE